MILPDNEQRIELLERTIDSLNKQIALFAEENNKLNCENAKSIMRNMKYKEFIGKKSSMSPTNIDKYSRFSHYGDGGRKEEGGGRMEELLTQGLWSVRRSLTWPPPTARPSYIHLQREEQSDTADQH